MGNDKKSVFWKSFLLATETEPRDASFIQGSSGLQHPVLGVGVDDKRRRVVIISGEHDARSAAIAQIDIQRALNDVSVIVARPIAINLATVAAVLAEALGTFDVNLSQIKTQTEDDNFFTTAFKDKEHVLSKMASSADYATLNWLAQWMQIVEQLSCVELSSAPPDAPIKVGIGRLAALDPTELDRELGICPVPLYEFPEEEAEKLQSGTDIDAVREALRNRDMLQYFFPAPDHLALGLVDRGVTSPTQLVNQLTTTSNIGHPLGGSEILPQARTLGDMIDELQSRNLLVEAEIGYEVSERGQTLRTSIRAKPREGVVAKIANNVSIKLDLSDLAKILKQGS